MFKVIDLSKKGKNYQVIIKRNDKEKTYLVSEDLVIEYRLVIGKEFDQKQMDKLLEEINRDAIYQKVLKYALYKPRTKKEIFVYLDKLKIEKFGYYITKLEKTKLLNDDLYAKNYIDDAINFKKIGPRKIYEDLRIKGIQEEKIVLYLESYNQATIIENIRYNLEKKVKSISNKTFLQAKKVLINFLLNKGFDYNDINHQINDSLDLIDKYIDENKIIKKEIAYLKEKYHKKEQKLPLKQYLIQKLLAKGYQYNIIKEYLEGSNK